MSPKISLAAAFLLMAAPPMACASSRVVANPTSMTSRAHQSSGNIVVAQDAQSTGVTDSSGDSDNANDNDNDNDSNDNTDQNQSADSGQADQNAAGNDQPLPPTVLNENENDPDDAPQFTPVPEQQMPVNPNQ